jgi:hypothetical protein
VFLSGASAVSAVTSSPFRFVVYKLSSKSDASFEIGSVMLGAETLSKMLEFTFSDFAGNFFFLWVELTISCLNSGNSTGFASAVVSVQFFVIDYIIVVHHTMLSTLVRSGELNFHAYL